MNHGRYQCLISRYWKDEYPDTLRVSVECSDETGVAFVVVSGAAVWLTDEQVEEVIEFTKLAQKLAKAYNTAFYSIFGQEYDE